MSVERRRGTSVVPEVCGEACLWERRFRKLFAKHLELRGELLRAVATRRQEDASEAHLAERTMAEIDEPDEDEEPRGADEPELVPFDEEAGHGATLMSDEEAAAVEAVRRGRFHHE